MSPADDMTKTTDEVIDRFNRAFRERDATLLEEIIDLDGRIGGVINLGCPAVPAGTYVVRWSVEEG